MLPCAYKYFFGIDCPICGAQRSLLLLMQGNFEESFKIYPPLVFLLILSVIAVCHLAFPSVIKARYLKSYSAIVLIIVLLNYTYKIATHNL